MNGPDLLVILDDAHAITWLTCLFLGTRDARQAELRDGVREVTVTFKGAHDPDVIRVEADTPVGLVFDRRACKVGDGISDAPALVRTDVSIAIGPGTMAASSLSVVGNANRLQR